MMRKLAWFNISVSLELSLRAEVLGAEAESG